MNFIALDTEATSLDSRNADLLMTSWYSKGSGNVILASANGVLQEFLAKYEKYPKIFWNAKYDLRVLRRAGIEIPGLVLDAYLLARVVMPKAGTYKLKKMAKKLLKIETEESDELEKWFRKKDNRGKGFGDVPAELLIPYCLKDSEYTHDLFYILWDNASKADKAVFKREMELMPAIMRMEDAGIQVDLGRCKEVLSQINIKLKEIQENITSLTDGSITKVGSRLQLVKWFYKTCKYPITRYTDAGKPSCNELALLEVNDRVSSAILLYRKLKKAGTTYVENLIKLSDDEGVLRATFNQAGAITGRLSSSNPNLQNLPRPSHSLLGAVRSCFVARPGYLLVFIDYSQIEIRIAAHYAEEDSMIEAIKSGNSVHGVTCKKLFDTAPGKPGYKKYYHLAKTLNFATLYGTGPATFRDTMLKQDVIISVAEATEYIAKFKQEFPKIKAMFDWAEDEVMEHQGVRTKSGRFMPILPGQSYKGVNYRIQGTAAEVMKKAIYDCDQLLLDKKSQLVATVHDELIFEVHHEEKRLVPELFRLMENHDEFVVPLTCTVAIGPRWSEKEEIGSDIVSRWRQKQ